MISAFGVEYREVSKASMQLNDKEKAVVVAGGTTVGARLGHWAYLTPDHAYNEHIHKPWFDYQKETARSQRGIPKDPKERAAARDLSAKLKPVFDDRVKDVETNAKTQYEAEKAKRAKQAAAGADIEPRIAQQKAAAEKKGKPFDEAKTREAMTRNYKAPDPMPEFQLTEGQKQRQAKIQRKQADLARQGTEHLNPTRMTSEQVTSFEDYTRNIPKKYHGRFGKHGYSEERKQRHIDRLANDPAYKAKVDARIAHETRKNPKKDPAKIKSEHYGDHPKNLEAIDHWSRSKEFFREFPKDLPGWRYRRAGGWYSKGKTGHAVAMAAMGTGAYLGYKGSKALVNKVPTEPDKVSKGVKVKMDRPKFLRQFRYVKEKDLKLKNWDKVIRDPGVIALSAIPASGVAGYAAMRHSQKDSGKKVEL